MTLKGRECLKNFVTEKVVRPWLDLRLGHVLAPLLAETLCLCLSVTSRCSIEVVARIELVFGMGASFDQSYSVC